MQALKAEWSALKAHQSEIESVHMRELFANDSNRFNTFSASACGILLDYSKNRITSETLKLLTALATRADIATQARRMCESMPPKTGQCCTRHCAYRPVSR